MTAANRSKAYRARRRSDRMVIRIEVDEFGVTDALIEVGALTEEQALSRAAVASAIGRVIEDWKNSVTRDAQRAFAARMNNSHNEEQ